jgi:hypothetical protein
MKRMESMVFRADHDCSIKHLVGVHQMYVSRRDVCETNSKRHIHKDRSVQGCNTV